MNTTKNILIGLSLLGLQACGGVPEKASPTDPAGNFYQVSTGLYRGGRPDLPGIGQLAVMGVQTDVDLENVPDVINQEETWAQASKVGFISSPMNGLDTPNDVQVNDVLALLADPSKRPVYVHCTQGVDRTGLIIALHRVKNEGWAPADAYDEMLAHGYHTALSAMQNYFFRQTGYTP